MSLAHVIVDVFTDTPLQGNQLAVFEDGSALSDDQMQRLARGMNLSETVFLLPAEDGGASTGRSSHPARYAGRAGANGRRMAADREAIDLSVSPSDLLHLPPTDPSAARSANF